MDHYGMRQVAPRRRYTLRLFPDGFLKARDALASLADTAGRYDADGIDVYFLNSTKIGTNMKVEPLHSVELTDYSANC